MTSTWWFPDNTVLCNFATVNRLDIVRDVLRGRGRWVEAIEYEVQRSARYIPALACVASEGWLGEPIAIEDPRVIETVSRTRRIVFDGTDDDPLQHLGESQTCVLIKSDPQFSESWWITDDRESIRYAQQQGITTRETIDIVSTAVVEGTIGSEAAYELMLQMKSMGRHLRVPGSAKELVL